MIIDLKVFIKWQGHTTKILFYLLYFDFMASHELHATHYGGAPSYKKWNKRSLETPTFRDN